MQSQSDWILALLQKYKQETSNNPVFISDWDTLNDKAEYPRQFIRNSLDIDVQNTFIYSFSDEQEAIKALITAQLDNITAEHVAITISATAAIYLSLLSLYRSGIKCFVVLTPVYYSIIETLNELGLEIHYFDLTDQNNFKLDIEQIRSLIKTVRANALVINDPIYCVGKAISSEVLNQLVETCNQNNCLLFLDSTLSGLEWNNSQPGILDKHKLAIITNADRYIMVDSLTKRLLVNGLKHAVVFACPGLINLIEDTASRVYGGFCYPQLQFMTELYDPENTKEVLGILQHNRNLIKSNYELLTVFLYDTPYQLYPSGSGYFTMIAHREYLCRDVDKNSQVETYLYKYNTFLLPPAYFNFSPLNHFSLRVNLLKDPSAYFSALGECVWEKVKLFH